MDIAVENLPPYESISCEPIRQAAAEHNAARSAKEQARKDLIELEQTREAAEWRDAEAAEQAQAEGKPEPKRSHVAAHDKQTDAARHGAKVAELAHTRARGALEAALAEHGEAWASELTSSIEQMSAEWGNALTELIDLHTRLAGALSVARRVGIGDLPNIDALAFSRRQIQNAEFASPQPNVPAYIPAGDVLAALATVIEVAEPGAEKTNVAGAVPLRRIRMLSPNAGQRGTDDEMESRRAFTEHANSPAGQAERERIVAERRARAQKHRQGAEEAEQAEAEQTFVTS